MKDLCYALQLVSSIIMLHSNLDLIPSLEVPDEVIISCVVEDNSKFCGFALACQEVNSATDGKWYLHRFLKIRKHNLRHEDFSTKP